MTNNESTKQIIEQVTHKIRLPKIEKILSDIERRSMVTNRYNNTNCIYLTDVRCNISKCSIAKCNRTSEYSGKDYFKVYTTYIPPISKQHELINDKSNKKEE